MLPTVLRSVPQIAYIGRTEDQQRLRATSSRCGRPAPRIVFLSGEPGVGKTRLAAQTALETHNAGFRCAGVPPRGHGAPYGPWIRRSPIT